MTVTVNQGVEEIAQDVQARVEQGYAWLVGEGWKYGLNIERIDLAKLHMLHPFACALTQAAGAGANFYDLLIRLSEADVYGPGDDFHWAMEHGFYHRRSSGIEYELLDFAWRRKLEVGRAA
jgi:hypothetical protein